MVDFEVVVRGGRVIDPSQGLDTSADLAIDGTRIAAIGPNLRGHVVLDATGCVVAPGFIDLHSHAQTVGGHRLQAFDGVTTTLELEMGAMPVSAAYAQASVEGRPLNYGYSASWAATRIEVLTGYRGAGRSMLARFADPGWQREATASEQDRILGRLEEELAAGETGAHMHYCHVNSTSGRHVDRVLALVDRVRRAGAIVTTEAYPYGAGMTAIGAAFLAPERLAERGIRPTDLVYAPTNERVRDVEHLTRLRAADPGGLCIVHSLDETQAVDVAVMRASLVHEDTMVASDAMPLTWLGPATDRAWPLPPSALTHPRTAGTFARSYRHLVGEGALSIAEFIRRASLLPARVVATALGGGVRKGALTVGADADVVTLEPDAFRDRATYEASTRPSTGVRHLLVGGEPVVRDGELVLHARPGRPVRRS